MKAGNKKFTLIEVVAALSILTISVVGLMTLAFDARQRLLRNHDRQAHFHMLQQAAEYFMLTRDASRVLPDTVFDYPGYTVDCVDEDSEGVIDDLDTGEMGFTLKCRVITLRNAATGAVVDQLKIDYIEFDDET